MRTIITAHAGCTKLEVKIVDEVLNRFKNNMEGELDKVKAYFDIHKLEKKLLIKIRSPGIKYIQSQVPEAFTLTPMFSVLLIISSVVIFNVHFVEDQDLSWFTSFMLHLLMSGAIGITGLLLLANHLFLQFGSTRLLIDESNFEISRRVLGIDLKERGKTKSIRAVGLVYEPISVNEDEKNLTGKCFISEKGFYRFGMYLSEDNQEQIIQALVSFIEEVREEQSYYSEYAREGCQEKMWRFLVDIQSEA